MIVFAKTEDQKRKVTDFFTQNHINFTDDEDKFFMDKYVEFRRRLFEKEMWKKVCIRKRKVKMFIHNNIKEVRCIMRPDKVVMFVYDGKGEVIDFNKLDGELQALRSGLKAVCSAWVKELKTSEIDYPVTTFQLSRFWE